MSVPVDGSGDFGDVEFLDPWEEEPVDLFAPDHEEVATVGRLLDLLHGAHNGDARCLRHCAGEDDIFSTGERLADRFVGFPTHEDRMTHGGRLEEFEIFGKMPRDCAGIPYNPVLCHSHNRLDHLETKMTANSRAEQLWFLARGKL